MRTLPLNHPDVARVRANERETLRKSWAELKQIYIAARSIDDLRMMLSGKDTDIHTIGRFPLERAFALKFCEDPVPCQCWISVNDIYYRTVYHRYLKQYHGFPADARLPKSIAIDHVLNRKNAIRSSRQNYVLLTMVDSDINSSFGRIFERNFEVNDRSRAPESDADPDLEESSADSAFAIFWPLMSKVFAEKAPPAEVSDRYILRVLRGFCRDGLIGKDELNQPYALMAALFRAGEPNRPRCAIGRRVPRGQHQIGGRVLTADLPLRTWLQAFAEELGEL